MISINRFWCCTSQGRPSPVALQVTELKDAGNAALQAGKFKDAIELYSQAIEMDKENPALYSNRSVAHIKAKEFEKALTDAEKVVELKPDWSKGYSRVGSALSSMSRHQEAKMAFEQALKLDPDNKQLKQAVEDEGRFLTGPAGSEPVMNPFADPNLFQKLIAEPRTRELMKDTDFVNAMKDLQQNPGALGKYHNDPRIMTALGVLLGMDLDFQGEEELHKQDVKDTVNEMREKRKEAEKEAAFQQKNAANAKSKETVELTDDQKKALEEKEKGNAAYKKKDFETAIKHYDEAIRLDPTNITFLTNKAAVYFEQSDLKSCIETCEKAIEVGRENRADFKLLAKAYARMGNAYNKQEDLENALTYYNKALSEHRTPEVTSKAKEIEKKLKEREKLAYINPELSLEEKTKGNKAFQEGDYPTALKHYAEAIKRNPEDAKIYSNRAACYTKLMEFSLALSDCEQCIKLDPKFIKGYLRKGACLLAMKDTRKAAEVYQKAMELDHTCQEAIDGYRRCVMCDDDPESVRKRAMADPEIQAILGDPAMQLILQQMQKDPKALQEHLKNPEVASKIQKLLESGLIAIR
ncbi:stress-induced-phosphoprotein 1-like [Lingula anatina]|uniref:Stress-induced-phosphoprotein 1 n=1 Tax=Lingula anatina TaxID=7574 RepID=A0A1S3KJ01_LINAN|nr:stress-induced-phosphoprotein 1-like [Lingula anatina]|eukprot:XP_013422191.1 stress-induced-phosphoprotein 1-like [Lingula anatina]